jgi:membrane protease YdiL (CAAX protease family)
LVAIALVAVVMTMQEYFGGRPLYDDVIRPWFERLESNGLRRIQLARYDELYGYAWWILARVIGYVLVPFPVWKLLYPKDGLLDLGLRTRGFSKHLWIYGLCLAIVIPTMLLVATQPDFGSYYPFYKLSSRSWFDFLAWEALYYLQFLALELFFRGFLVGTLRKSLGSASIFVMTLPYCMIHYGKPYFEANGAIVAGIVLGSLAAKTRSIYAGFLVHVTVAASMDILSLWHRHAIPTVLWPGG